MGIVVIIYSNTLFDLCYFIFVCFIENQYRSQYLQFIDMIGKRNYNIYDRSGKKKPLMILHVECRDIRVERQRKIKDDFLSGCSGVADVCLDPGIREAESDLRLGVEQSDPRGCRSLCEYDESDGDALHQQNFF